MQAPKNLKKFSFLRETSPGLAAAGPAGAPARLHGPAQTLERARREAFHHVAYYPDGTAYDTGEEARFRLLDGMGGRALDRFEEGLPAPLPADVRELLAFATGFAVGEDEIEFNQVTDLAMDVLRAPAIDLGADGEGNRWVVEINRSTGAWSPVWYLREDPPVALLQCASLADFIDAVLDDYRLERCLRGHRGRRHHLYDRCFDVWARRDQLPRASEFYSGARAGADRMLRDFAAELHPRARVTDLRGAAPGAGFVWSGSDSFQPIRRHRAELLFAVEPRHGFWDRLTGRKARG